MEEPASEEEEYYEEPPSDDGEYIDDEEVLNTLVERRPLALQSALASAVPVLTVSRVSARVP